MHNDIFVHTKDSTTVTAEGNGQSSVNPSGTGPNEEKLKAILDRTGYTLDVTTGQRKYGGPPPDWEGPPPGPGCEVSKAKIGVMKD